MSGTAWVLIPYATGVLILGVWLLVRMAVADEAKAARHASRLDDLGLDDTATNRVGLAVLCGLLWPVLMVVVPILERREFK